MGKAKLNYRYHGLKGLTLVEMLTVIAVGIIVFGAGSGAFMQARRSWRAANTKVELTENARWAMEFIAKEIQGVADFVAADDCSAANLVAFYAPGQDFIGALSFFKDEDGDGSADDRVWYWKGDNDTHANCTASIGYCLGEPDILYRGVDLTDGSHDNTSLLDANDGNAATGIHYFRQPIAHFLVNNTNDAPVFSEEDVDTGNDTIADARYINILLTLERPDNPGHNYTFRERVFLRNVSP